MTTSAHTQVLVFVNQKFLLFIPKRSSVEKHAESQVIYTQILVQSDPF